MTITGLLSLLRPARVAAAATPDRALQAVEEANDLLLDEVLVIESDVV
jgi:hypothetical protein